MLLSGAEIIIECLKEQGVDTVFGYPGGTVINVYDALYCHGEGIRHILTAHEQGAAHAADGYARSTGRTGVCLVTSGPGATNLVTGIATAYMDSVPLVAITINVPTEALGKDSFQEVDIAGITMPVTKHNFIVKEISQLADVVRRAFKIAGSGRPGPVLIDITKDVTVNCCEYEPRAINSAVSCCREQITDAAALKKAVRLMKKAEKPVLLVGGGAAISGASDVICRLCDTYRIPVVDTLMGKGVFPGNRCEYLGMVGIHGEKAANYAVSNADLLIAVGTRFSERVTGKREGFARAAKKIQIDIERAELNKNILVDVALAGDAGAVTGQLCDAVGEAKSHEAWLKMLLDMKNKYSCKAEPGTKLTGVGVVRAVYEATDGQAIVATEVGQNQMWTAKNYIFSRPRQLLTSGGLGTMGYGLGAAIGAQLGNPDKVVVNIAGDGCFRMNMNELSTAAANNLPIIEIILDNHALGMVRQMQRMFFDGRFSQTDLADNIDYIKLAEAMGAVAVKAENTEEIIKAVRDGMKQKRPTVIVCPIDSTENVWPVVKPGESLDDTCTEEEFFNA